MSKAGLGAFVKDDHGVAAKALLPGQGVRLGPVEARGRAKATWLRGRAQGRPPGKAGESAKTAVRLAATAWLG